MIGNALILVRERAAGPGILLGKFTALHGGRIWVTSEPGQGSTFTFTLPAGGPEGADAPA